MKKLSLLALLVATCTVAMAQPRAIGGRIGYSYGISYQHQIGEKSMIQADLDLLAYRFQGIQGTATFNWIIPLKACEVVNWNLITGVGAGVGFQRYGGGDIIWFPLDYGGRGIFVGVAGMIGMEWNFKFPLQLAIEYRPLIGPIFSQKRDYYEDYSVKKEGIGVDFYYRGLFSGALAIGIRYKFSGK